jgi:hypothetical protein
MPQSVGDGPDVDSGAEQLGGDKVTQVMEANVF